MHSPVLSGGHDPAVSGAHTPFLSGLHVAALSAAHDPVSSSGHAPDISGFHDPVASGGHDPALSVLHDPVSSGAHVAVISAAHEPTVSGGHSPVASAAHDPIASGLHDPTVSGGAHATAISAFHAPAASAAHNPALSAAHGPVSSATHNPTLSAAHDPVASAAHDPTISQFHNPIASGAHDPAVSAGHNANLSGIHTPALSGGHSPADSATHDPIGSQLGDPGGPPPVLPFDELFDFLPPVVFSGPGSLQGSLAASLDPWARVFVMARRASTQETVLADDVAIGLGLATGARLVTLGSGARAILPVSFVFTSGWDAPPRGSIFDLGGRIDLMPAPVDSALPPGLAGWSEDLLLPAATTSAQVGFNPVTFAGATGTSPASFAAQFGDGLLSMWRFDAAGQRWLSFIAGAPARVNTLTTLGTRDALLVKTAQATTVQQIDFIPRTGAARSVLLEAGGNLVSYTGGGGDIAALTAAVGGLRTVSVFDARDQRWRVFVRGAPPQVSQVSTLSRLDAVFIVVDTSTRWAYTEETAAGSSP